MSLKCRQACLEDLNAIVAFDPVANSDPYRSAYLRESIGANQCLVACANSEIVGYGVLNYHFFGCGFVSLVVTHPKFRRQGIATRLLVAMENSCATPKIFLSTNQSNVPMQALAERLGYVRSGIIENLDEGDPELVYFKRVSAPLNAG